MIDEPRIVTVGGARPREGTIELQAVITTPDGKHIGIHGSGRVQAECHVAALSMQYERGVNVPTGDRLLTLRVIFPPGRSTLHVGECIPDDDASHNGKCHSNGTTYYAM